MTDKLVDQIFTSCIDFKVFPLTLSATKNITVPFPVDEVIFTKIAVTRDSDTAGYEQAEFTDLRVFSNLAGSLTQVGCVPFVKATKVTASDLEKRNGNYHFPTRFTFPKTSRKPINGSFTFSVQVVENSDTPPTTPSLAAPLTVYIQIEFVQYIPVPQYQKDGRDFDRDLDSSNNSKRRK